MLKTNKRNTSGDSAENGRSRENMSVCYFGAYQKDYSRNVVIRKGLERRGVRVVECWSESGNVVARYFRLALKFMRIGRDCDVILVGAGRHMDVPLARALGVVTGKKVILDIFISHYDTTIEDRGLYGPKSRQAFILSLVDRWGALLAHYLLMDTNAHINYYVERYRLSKERFRKVLVSADNSFFKPVDRKPEGDGIFHALFYGSYIPLQGVDVILRAAKLLEGERDIAFHLVGDGQTYPDARRLHDELGLKNVVFTPWSTKTELAGFLSECDVSLGIFGVTEKASRVIPNKAYEALATRTALISADTEGMAELFVNREHALLCPTGDPQALADSILELKRNPALRNHLAEKGHELFVGDLLPEMVVEPIIELMTTQK